MYTNLNMKSVIYFFIEHKSREYETVKQVSLLLKLNYDISSYIFSIPFHSHYLLWLPQPDLVALPFAISEDDYPLNVIRSKYNSLVPILDLCWEQLLTESNKAYKTPRKISI